jgi:hypothetical protein
MGPATGVGEVQGTTIATGQLGTLYHQVINPSNNFVEAVNVMFSYTASLPEDHQCCTAQLRCGSSKEAKNFLGLSFINRHGGFTDSDDTGKEQEQEHAKGTAKRKRAFTPKPTKR